MTYKTNLIQDKRNQLKLQMDDFATFQWRGHNMFDKYGCFIINEKKGSLKFYNGPGFSNKYAKPQFANATRGLLGVDFKQQTISFKVALYWFTIEEYQDFLNEISPYNINYLSFDFDPRYAYLVKLSNIKDSERRVVGNSLKVIDDTTSITENRYYTELDLTWDVLGDAGVRSVEPYSYNAEYRGTVGNNSTPSQWSCTWRLDKEKDMSDDSLLDTSLIFELPVGFSNYEATLKLRAKNQMRDDLLFDINLQNLVYNRESNVKYFLKTSLLDSMKEYNYQWSYFANCICLNKRATIHLRIDGQTSLTQDDYTVKKAPSSDGSLSTELTVYQIDFKDNVVDGTVVWEKLSDGDVSIVSTSAKSYTVSIKKTGTPKPPIGSITIKGVYCTKVSSITIPGSYKYQNLKLLLENSSDEYNVLLKLNRMPTQLSSEYQADLILVKLGTDKKIEKLSSLYGDLVVISNKAILIVDNDETTIEILSDHLIEASPGFSLSELSDNQYQSLLRYDSESGLLYIQEGANDTWHLLNFQTDNTKGEYLLKSATVNKWKMPGLFSAPNLKTTEWEFYLETEGVNLALLSDYQWKIVPTVYARKNVI